MNRTDRTSYKYVFVCGLQRSGTSILARNIGKLQDCTVFKDTGAIEDEGQYLQNVYPTNNELGGTGWYGFDDRSHLTEASFLLTSENIASLRRSWHSHWDNSKSICVEKTPGNLLMTRFLQAAFPNSYFVVVKRHPVPVSMANQRWKKSIAPLHVGFQHWLHCYTLFEHDKPHLNNVYEMRYEDYIADPSRYHREIAEFIGTGFSEDEMEELAGAHNNKYFERWHYLLSASPFRGYYRYIAQEFESQVSDFGYSLKNPPREGAQNIPSMKAPPAMIGKLYSRGADVYALGWRLASRIEGIIRRFSRRLLPATLKDRIRPHVPRRGVETRSPSIR